MLSAAEVLSVEEVGEKAQRRRFVSDGTSSFSARVTGKLTMKDPERNTARLEWDGCAVLLDTQALPRFSWPLNTLLQVMGEVPYSVCCVSA